MQDTLEPALDLFDDLVPEPDLSARTATQTLAPESVRVAEHAASRLRAAGPQPPTRRRNSALHYVAAAMVGAALMGIMGTINDARSPAIEASAGAVVPAVDASVCPWQTNTLDRRRYPTKEALALACMNCHASQPTPIDTNAEPISTEIPSDLSAAVDSLMRDLWNRDQWSLSTAIAAVPRVQHAALTSLLCAVAAVPPRSEQIA